MRTISLALGLLLGVQLLGARAYADTAITYSVPEGTYGWCTNMGTLSEARSCALGLCAEEGGSACAVVAECGAFDRGGWLAVARGDPAGFGAVCGADSANAARALALMECIVASGNQCWTQEASVDSGGRDPSSEQNATFDVGWYVQTGLVLAGHDVGGIDGVVGGRTRAAIRAFEAAQGMPETGQVSDALWDALLAAIGGMPGLASALQEVLAEQGPGTGRRFADAPARPGGQDASPPRPAAVSLDPALFDDCQAMGDPPRRIKGCTRLIISRAVAGADLAMIHFNRGLTYGDLARYPEAIADFDEAIRLDPRYAKAYMARAMAHDRLGETERAIGDARQAYALDPNDPWIREQHQLLTGQAALPSKPAPAPAPQPAPQAAEDDPFLTSDFLSGGFNLALLNFFKAEAGITPEELRAEPDWSERYRGLAVCYGRAYAGLPPDDKQVILSHMNQPDDPQVREIVTRDPAMLAAARACDPGQAAGPPEPASEPADQQLVEICVEGADMHQVVKACSALIASGAYRSANLSTLHQNRGFGYADMGRSQEAIADFDEAIRINPDNANAYMGRALAYQRLGDGQQAVIDASQAYALDPADPWIRDRYQELVAQSTPAPEPAPAEPAAPVEEAFRSAVLAYVADLDGAAAADLQDPETRDYYEGVADCFYQAYAELTPEEKQRLVAEGFDGATAEEIRRNNPGAAADDSDCHEFAW